MFIFMKNINFILVFFLEILLYLIFWVLWACMAMPTKIIVSTWRKLWYLCECKNQNWPLIFFLRYYTLLNPAIWLVKSIWPMTWEPNLSRHWICGKISMAIWLFISYYFLEKAIVYFWPNQTFSEKSALTRFSQFWVCITM